MRDMLTIADVRVEGITHGIPVGMRDERQPCQYRLTLRMHVTNQRAQQVTLVARRMLLLDRYGRSLASLDNVPDVKLGPRGSAEVTVLLPALHEADEPALISIDSNNFQTFALVKVQPK